MHNIVLAPFPFIDNTDVTKLRPCLCLTSSLSEYDLVVIAFMTSIIEPLLPSDVLLSNKFSNITGLIKPTKIVLHKLTTIPLAAAQAKIGQLPTQLETELSEKIIKMMRLSSAQ